MECLIAYDIADPKRLRQVAKVMGRFGVRVQKSVFECNLPETVARKMLEQVAAVMDKAVDGVRMYPLPANSRSRQTILGRGTPAPFPPAYVS